MDKQKKCTMCKVYKDLTNFYKNRTRGDGLSYNCKACVKVYRREYQKRPKYRLYYNTYKKEWQKQLKYVEYRREYQTNSELYKERHRIGQKAYVKNNPEKALAHRLAREHKAEIMKEQCERCGAKDKLHMHHPDYTRPLYVLTLCIPCHERQHHAI